MEGGDGKKAEEVPKKKDDTNNYTIEYTTILTCAGRLHFFYRSISVLYIDFIVKLWALQTLQNALQTTQLDDTCKKRHFLTGNSNCYDFFLIGIISMIGISTTE